MNKYRESACPQEPCCARRSRCLVGRGCVAALCFHVIRWSLPHPGHVRWEDWQVVCRLCWLKRERSGFCLRPLMRKAAVSLPHTYSAVLICGGQGVTRRCRLSWLTRAPLVYEPKCGGGGCGSQPMRTAVHITWHGAQINFGDLAPYLTYGGARSTCTRTAVRKTHSGKIYRPL